MTSFCRCVVTETESFYNATSLVDTACDEGLRFKDVTINDVVLAVSHFKSQATGSDGIPHKIIAKTLPAIGHFRNKLFKV